MGRVHVENVARHQLVEQHPERRQVLLDGRRGELALQVLDEGGDVEGLDVGQTSDAVGVAPLGEASRRVQVRLAGVVVVDLRGEEFEDALGGLGRGREQRSGLKLRLGERMISVVVAFMASPLKIGCDNVLYNTPTKPFSTVLNRTVLSRCPAR